MIAPKDKEQVQDFTKQLLTLLGDLNDIEKTISKLRNEVSNLYIKLDNMLDT